MSVSSGLPHGGLAALVNLNAVTVESGAVPVAPTV
jgi:hypothetical protein